MSRNTHDDSTSTNGGRSVRLDTDHHLHEMMRSAVQKLQRGQIDLQLTDQSVLLQGRVNSWSEKQAVQESIRNLSASRVIQNDLEVANW